MLVGKAQRDGIVREKFGAAPAAGAWSVVGASVAGGSGSVGSALSAPSHPATLTATDLPNALTSSGKP
jgi:hypothetical protein